MMADLMRDHIGGGEIAWRAETLRKLAEEAGVEIKFLVCGTVKRADSG